MLSDMDLGREEVSGRVFTHKVCFALARDAGTQVCVGPVDCRQSRAVQRLQ